MFKSLRHKFFKTEFVVIGRENWGAHYTKVYYSGDGTPYVFYQYYGSKELVLISEDDGANNTYIWVWVFNRKLP